jgi:alcohol dehydrogenase, propanol-preferring
MWLSRIVLQPWCQKVRQLFQLLGSEALIDLRCTGITPAQAAVATDAVMTAYHAVKRTGAVKSTDTVVIFGLGGLGFNALQIVLAIGSRVIVIDKRDEVIADAVNFGVPKQDVIPVGKDPVEFVQEHNLVVDVVIDFVGTNDTFAASQQLGKSRSHDFTGFASNY